MALRAPRSNSGYSCETLCATVVYFCGSVMLSRFLNLWLSVSLCVFYTGCFYWSCPISMSVSKLCHPSGACRICLHIKPGIGIAPSDCALKVFSPVYYESVAMNTRTLRHCVVGGTHLSKVYQYINIVERFSEHGHGK